MRQDQETLGCYLKGERELRRVPVQEIALRVKAERRLVDALEGDDYDVFNRRSEALWLVKAYSAYLNLDQKEILRRFDVQWKLSGGVKRYPKLTHFTDHHPSAGRPDGSSRKRSLAGHPPQRKAWLFVILGCLIVGSALFLYLTNPRQEGVPQDTLLPTGAGDQTASSSDQAPPPAAATEVRKRTPVSVSVPAVPQAPVRVSAEKPSPPAKNVTAVGNRDTKRYHLPGMKYYDKVKAYHRVVFQSERQAINAGYTKARE